MNDLDELIKVVKVSKDIRDLKSNSFETFLTESVIKKMIDVQLTNMYPTPPRQSYLNDFFNSNMMTKLGDRLPEMLPNILEKTLDAIGDDRIGKIVDIVLDELDNIKIANDEKLMKFTYDSNINNIEIEGLLD